MVKKLNKAAREILEILESKGFFAYIVGGYVRDYLLGISSTDIDICTNASMKDVLSLLVGKINKYHSFTMRKKELTIDITSCRIDGEYNGRRPKEVFYTDDLKKDLERRDFTINTICMNKEGEIFDFLDGIVDLKRKIIKMVGDPQKRIKEDVLRILRAIRFATVLDFKIDNVLEKAIKENAYLLTNLSGYRIKEEVSKILLSKHFKKGLSYLKRYGICPFIGISFSNLIYTSDLCGMWAQINIKRELPFTKQEKKNIVKIQEILKVQFITKEVLYSYDLYFCLIAAEILGINKDSIHEMYQSMPIYQRKDLAISFFEIQEVLQIFDARKVKEIENSVIREILNGHMKNEKEKLKEYIFANRSRWL